MRLRDYNFLFLFGLIVSALVQMTYFIFVDDDKSGPFPRWMSISGAIGMPLLALGGWSEGEKEKRIAWMLALMSVLVSCGLLLSLLAPSNSWLHSILEYRPFPGKGP